MSIEQSLATLTTAINTLNANIDTLITVAAKAATVNPAATQQVAAGAQMAQVAQQVVQQVQQPIQQMQQPVQQVQQMAAPFDMSGQMVQQPIQQPVQQAIQLPFNDGAGLVQYTMATYQAIGPEKGARIQQVLNSLGVANINDIKPEQYVQFYQGVEQIKNS